MIGKISINPKFLEQEVDYQSTSQAFYYSFLQASFQAMVTNLVITIRHLQNNISHTF